MLKIPKYVKFVYILWCNIAVKIVKISIYFRRSIRNINKIFQFEQKRVKIIEKSIVLPQNMAESMANLSSEQEDEILALSSIFGDDFCQNEYTSCRTIYQIKVKVNLVGKKLQINAWMPSEENDGLASQEQNTGDEMGVPNSPVKKITFQRSQSKRHTCLKLSVSHLTPLTLEFSCPPNYPAESKPTFTLSCMWLDAYQLTRLCEKLDELWETNFQGEPVIFPWVDWLQNSSLEYLEADDILTLKPYDYDLGTARDPRGLPEFLDPKACALKILEYDFKMVQTEFRKERHTCEICFEEREGILFHFLEECGHKYCVECLLDYCQLHVNEGTVKRLKCPEPKCPTTLSPIILRELLSDEDFERWERLLFQQTLDGMIDVLYCPRCNTVVLQDEDETSRLAQCGGCYFTFCTDCLMSWHSTQNCGGDEVNSEAVQPKKSKKRKPKKKASENLDDPIQEEVPGTKKQTSAAKQSFEFVMLQKRLGKYQRCPKCRIMVERTSGCDMMHCSRCSQAFCFRCGRWLKLQTVFTNLILFVFLDVI